MLIIAAMLVMYSGAMMIGFVLLMKLVEPLLVRRPTPGRARDRWICGIVGSGLFVLYTYLKNR